MRKLLFITLISITALSTASGAFAAGKGNGGGMSGHNAASGNSNGIHSTDRDRGLSRAAERRNVHSLNKKHVKKIRAKKINAPVARGRVAK